MPTPSAALKWLAIAAIIGTGLVHFGEARDAFGDATYKGVLFVANGIGSLVAAFGIYRDRRGLGWILGLVIAAGSVAAYVMSRTIGLPGLPAEPENWLEPPGVASLVCEGLFVLLFFVAERTRSGDAASRTG